MVAVLSWGEKSKVKTVGRLEILLRLLVRFGSIGMMDGVVTSRLTKL